MFSALTSATNPSGTTLVGKVTAIDPTSTVTSSVVTYGATITLTKPPAGDQTRPDRHGDGDDGQQGQRALRVDDGDHHHWA